MTVADKTTRTESDRDPRDDESGDDSDDEAQPKRSFDLIHTGKLGFFVLLLFVLLMSDVFVERVMARAGVGLVNGRVPTERGIAVQGVILVLGLIIFDLLITKSIL